MTNSALATQEQWNLAQGQNEKTAAADQQVSRIDSMTPGVQPSPLGMIAGIGTAGINALTGNMRTQNMNSGGSSNMYMGFPMMWGGGLNMPGIGA
jgi:hypothetical protein